MTRKKIEWKSKERKLSWDGWIAEWINGWMAGWRERGWREGRVIG